MDLWINIRPSSWTKVILKHMASIILKHSRQFPEWILSGFCSPLLLICDGPCSNWMSKNAFLYGDLHEKVYMEQPPGYVAQGEIKVCHLKKAIYGLKQSPRTWFEKFSITISSIGFHRCHSVHSVFIWRTKFDIVVLAIYVDNILLIGSDSAKLLETKKYLKCHLWPRTWNVQNTFWKLKLHIKNTVYFFFSESILWIFLRKGLLRCKAVNTPMKANVDLWWWQSYTWWSRKI